MPDLEVMMNAPIATAERRQWERVLYDDLKMSYDGCTETINVRSPNLTPYGMFVNTPRIFAEGAELRLRFDLRRTGVLVQTAGKVRYCCAGVGVGVQFIRLPAYARAAIEKELEIVRNDETRTSKN